MTDLKDIESLLRQGKISRREFMRRASVLGLAGAAPLSVLGTSSAYAAPKKGGVLRMGLGGGSTDDTLDPGTITASVNQVFSYSIRNSLIEIAPDGSLVGELAKSWEGSNGAKDWVFKLRRGVEFHNGKSLTANDVVASLQHHIREDSNSAMKGNMKSIVDVKADGKRVVRVKLSEGNADFPWLMTDYHLVMWPEGESPLDGTGTGPFILQEFEPGVRLSAKRNPNYWERGRPYFDEVQIVVIEDANARESALKTGQVDVINRVDAKTATLLGGTNGINIESISGTGHYTIPMFADTAPFDDANVRRALRWAIDREALVKTILNGYGSAGNDLPIAKHQQYYNTELEQRTYDPDKAKHFLKKAGLSNLSVQLSASDSAFAGAVDAAVLYKEHAAKAGINIEVVRESSDGYWSNVWLVKPWVMCYWGGRPTQDLMWSVAYQKGADWNDNHWYNDRFQQLLVSAKAELDDNKRKDMYWEMQRLHWDEGATIVPLFNDYIAGVSDKIAHDKVAANWEMDGFKAPKRWWQA